MEPLRDDGGGRGGKSDGRRGPHSGRCCPVVLNTVMNAVHLRYIALFWREYLWEDAGFWLLVVYECTGAQVHACAEFDQKKLVCGGGREIVSCHVFVGFLK